MSAVDVSVVIVNWNTREDLRRCLDSVERQTTGVSYEVFVVDNASADGSAAMVREDFPQVRLICNSVNRGFAAANNQALPLASGRYVLLLNPDTSILDNAIARTVRAADADPAIGILGCQVLMDAATIQNTCFRFSTAFDEMLINTGLDRKIPASWFSGGPELRTWDRRTARDVEVVSGMYMLVRRAAMDQVGHMDEAYFVYGEEADWCFRFRKAGWRCSFTTDARIFHHGGGGTSTSQASVRMYVQLQKSILVFHRKHRGPASRAALKLVYLLTNSARLLVWGCQFALQPRPDRRDRVRCAAAALRYHLTGRFPDPDRARAPAEPQEVSR